MFKYETHLHTSETSKCGKSSGAEMARHFAALGYTGIFVTDHFFNGNTTVPADLPWEERVKLFLRGYEAAAEEGEKCGLDVFFAWEYSCGWAHFLTYGLGADWLLAHPDLLQWSAGDYFDRVHEAGGIIVHAHPWRLTDNPLMRMFPEKTDAVEVINAGRAPEQNRQAADYARSFGFAVTAGSDIHATKTPRRAGVLTDHRLKDGADFAKAVLERKVKIFAEQPVL